MTIQVYYNTINLYNIVYNTYHSKYITGLIYYIIQHTNDILHIIFQLNFYQIEQRNVQGGKNTYTIRTYIQTL